MDWVSFDEIKKAVTLQMAIEHYNLPLRRMNATTLRGRCPLPTHRSEKSIDSFTATLSKGVGGAWACQSQSCAKARGRVGGNVLDFVAAMEQCSVRDAAIKLQIWFLVPAAGEQPALRSKEPQVEDKPSSKEPGERVPPEKLSGLGEHESNPALTFTLRNIDHRHPYLDGRGLSAEISEEFGVGFFPGKGSMQNRIVIPIHNGKGELVAYAGRSIDESEPRYRFPPRFRKSSELFNLHRVKGELSVALVEGFFDCIKVTQAGFPCVALMGSTMSKAQENRLCENFASVIVMLDGDEAGRAAAEKITDRLQRVAYHVALVVLPDGAQPDQLSADELQRQLDGKMTPSLSSK